MLGESGKRHSPRNLFNLDFNRVALDSSRDVYDVFVVEGDAIATLADVLDGDLVFLAFLETWRGGHLFLLPHRPDRADSTAGIAAQHQRTVFLNEVRVRPGAFTADDVCLNVLIESVLQGLHRDLALEDDTAAGELTGSADAAEKELEKMLGITIQDVNNLVEISDDRRVAFIEDVDFRDFETLIDNPFFAGEALESFEEIIIILIGHSCLRTADIAGVVLKLPNSLS